MSDRPGIIILFGSGETSSSGQKVFDWLFRRLGVGVHVAILETPAGFELNSAQVASRIGDFLSVHLKNYRPAITIVPARKRGTPYSPDDSDIAGLIPEADAIFMGPGSPTYAVRQLKDSLTWHTTQACHRLGKPLILSSAAVIAIGARVLPVYEIYKAGEDPHWREGLDLFGPYGASVVFIPHWNNQDGGIGLDTSHCFMGRARFEALVNLLPSNVTVVGIDENTALAIDLAEDTCRVLGNGGIAMLRGREELRFTDGQTFSIRELGPFTSVSPDAGIPNEVWTRVKDAKAREGQVPIPPREALRLMEEREAARAGRDWAKADALREQVSQLGWRITDTPQGPRLEPL
jgi:cyanophycinase-like exopeptidase